MRHQTAFHSGRPAVRGGPGWPPWSLILLAASLLIAVPARGQGGAGGAAPDYLQSAESGAWSEPSTWTGGEVPGEGDRVYIRTGHRVVYDVQSEEAIRTVHVSGTLHFSTDRDTRLDVGLIRIGATPPGEDGSGVRCRHEPPNNGDAPTGDRPALLIGTPAQPVAPEHRALVRLVHFEGMDREDLPAIVCCGGRMDIHGAPMERTWVELAQPAAVGDTRLFLAHSIEGWRSGDRIVITATSRQRPFAGNATAHVTDRPGSEVRRIEAINKYGPELRERLGSEATLIVDRPLDHPHRAEPGYAGEIANLSRNVVIESADPDGVRGHTMYHRHSTGSISYAEFRHLGKRGVLARYPIHYHLVGDTMRGSSVLGASVWDSHNRWVTLHGSQYLVVRDCVGYRSVGHGYFLENGKEVFNVLDRNLAIQAVAAEPLPEQALPFDHNDGAGFWWANSRNAFTRNVAVECDQHGYRFEAVKTEAFDPVLAVPQPDGSTREVDIRTLPFVRFEGNEAHAQRRFALNLGGIRGATFSGPPPIDQPESVGGDVNGVGPDRRHPFIIRDLKVWDAHWAFHGASPSVIVDGLDIYDSQYGIWRSVVSRHKYLDLRLRELDSASIYFPMGGYGPEIGLNDENEPSFPQIDPVDDMPPATMITHVVRHGETVRVSGTTIDNGEVSRVLVNGVEAEAGRPNFAEWSVTLPSGMVADGELRAHAEDEAGNTEPRPHVRMVNPSAAKASGSRGREAP